MLWSERYERAANPNMNKNQFLTWPNMAKMRNFSTKLIKLSFNVHRTKKSSKRSAFVRLPLSFMSILTF